MVSCRFNCRAGKAIMWGLLSLLSLSLSLSTVWTCLSVYPSSIVVPVRAGELSVLFLLAANAGEGKRGGGREGRGV